MQDSKRRLLIAGGALFAPSALFAQAKDPKVARIGWLGTGFSGSTRALELFRQRLRELNYVEGRDLVLEVVWADAEQTKVPVLAKELTQRKVDVIVVGGTTGARATQSATSGIPIVAAGASDLAEAGLIKSLAKPGGNLTGISVNSPDAATKQTELMREIMPNARRAAVLWQGPRSPFLERQRKELEATLPARFELTWHTARVRSDLPPVFEAIHIFRPEFLVVLTDPVAFANRKELAGYVTNAKIPAVYGFREFVESGGLVSYGANILQSFRLAADYVDRILKGAKPADMPVQIPTKLELAVNIGAARALGLRFPQAMLARADVIVP
jgi:putative ABC transport system substrate-binding protein